MTVRTRDRIEVRLDPTHRDQLARVLTARGVTVSEFVRDAIEAAERDLRSAEFRAAVEELQRTATWTPTEAGIRELLDDPQCPELELDD
jgi:hypothetical protein